MKKFRGAGLNMVVATDVAARGLDVKDIALVINYDFPTGTSALYTLVHTLLFVLRSSVGHIHCISNSSELLL
jgi:superfamily II DNA/RNA helicase